MVPCFILSLSMGYWSKFRHDIADLFNMNNQSVRESFISLPLPIMKFNLPKRQMPNRFFLGLNIAGSVAGVCGIAGAFIGSYAQDKSPIVLPTLQFLILFLGLVVALIEWEKVRVFIQDLGAFRSHRAFLQFVLAIALFTPDSGRIGAFPLVMGIFVFLVFVLNMLTVFLIIDEKDGELVSGTGGAGGFSPSADPVGGDVNYDTETQDYGQDNFDSTAYDQDYGADKDGTGEYNYDENFEN